MAPPPISAPSASTDPAAIIAAASHPAPPCWCGNYFIVKSTTAVLGIDLGGSRYFVLDVQEGADTYGEYLATTGTAATFVTYTNIDSNPIVGASRKVCSVRVWQRA